MKYVTEVHHFLCKCSKCGTEVQNNSGVKELKENGWHELKDDLLCPECIKYYAGLKPSLGDGVVCLITDESRHLKASKGYFVCDIVKDNSHSTYVDVGNGWQARLDLGEYDIY